jgi:RIO kinase 1
LPDFTKQYNRVRQSYAAADGGPSTSTARPLPARNANAANSRAAKKHAAPAHAGTTGKALVNPGVLGGVSANPKSAADRANTKDKADRATHEQVLDARTRLVLSALVNRGFFGVIDGVVSTGKEVS